jgi:hypothetical protein
VLYGERLSGALPADGLLPPNHSNGTELCLVLALSLPLCPPRVCNTADRSDPFPLPPATVTTTKDVANKKTLYTQPGIGKRWLEIRWWLPDDARAGNTPESRLEQEARQTDRPLSTVLTLSRQHVHARRYREAKRRVSPASCYAQTARQSSSIPRKNSRKYPRKNGNPLQRRLRSHVQLEAPAGAPTANLAQQWCEVLSERCSYTKT